MNATQWPKDFILDKKKKTYAIKHGVDPYKMDDFWEDFHDWCLANGAKYKDWDAAFRMRVRKAKNWNLFQGHARKSKPKSSNQNDKIMKGYNALIAGGNIDMIAKRLDLSPYERECVEMAFSGGPMKVKKLSSGMLKEA